MSLRNTVATLAGAVALLATLPAQAAVVVTTFAGDVYGGIDPLNLFNQGAGAVLSGYTFIATFRTDTDTVGAVQTSSALGSGIYGGSNVGTAPPVSATLTLLNGSTELSTLLLTGSYYGSNTKTLWNGPGNPNALELQAANSANLLLDLFVSSPSPQPELSDPSYATSIDWSVGPLGYFGNQTVTNRGYLQYGQGGGEIIGLATNRVTVSVERAVAGVPEPATWAMIVVGFFGMGVAMRSRRRNSACAAISQSSS